MTSIGAHVDWVDPFAEATTDQAAAAQFFLGDPQGWKDPAFPGDPAAVRDTFAEAGIDIYIHAPYRINVATTNNRIRIPSRKLLGQYLDAAAAIGAKALIVHGGYVDTGVDVEVGYENWQKAVERVERPVPMLIENTAGGGDRAMARGLDALARLWDAISGGLDDNVGFCLDTCHAFAGGEDLEGIVDRVKAITGRIDLVHCNNSRDEQGSGRDRHAGICDGTIDPAQLLDVVRAAGATTVCETPDPAADIRWLREQLSV